MCLPKLHVRCDLGQNRLCELDASDTYIGIFKKARCWVQGYPAWVVPTRTQTRLSYDQYTKHFTIKIQNYRYGNVMFLDKPVRPAFEVFDSKVYDA